jgi:hypothetical protein
MLFLGAGASIPAGVPGVEKMVDRLLETLSNEPEYLELFRDIVDLLQKWVDAKKNKLDIELLLEAIEKVENKDDDVSSTFYDNEKNVIQRIHNVWLNSNKKVLLSDMRKNPQLTLFFFD